MWAGLSANKVYETDPTSVTPSAVSNGNPSGVVPSTLFAQRDGELSDGSAFPEVRVQGATKVANTGGDGFVGFIKSRSPGEGLSDGCSGVDGGFGSVSSKSKCRG